MGLSQKKREKKKRIKEEKRGTKAQLYRVG